jgi:heptosyltransferase III
VRVLIVRACAIGDFVLNLPALRALSLANPEARFTFVGYPSTLALSRTFLPVEAIYSIESPPWSSLFIEALPGLPMHFDSAYVWMKDPIFADNLERTGVRDVRRANPFPVSAHAASHLMSTVNLPVPELPDLWDAAASGIILHPGSGSPSKVWPHFQELARALPDAAVLIGPDDTDLKVSNARLRNLSLTEVADELRRCRVFIGNDSGITHVAAYWGTPTVALFGPTDPNVWGPVGRRVKVLKKPLLHDISVEDVTKLL